MTLEFEVMYSYPLTTIRKGIGRGRRGGGRGERRGRRREGLMGNARKPERTKGEAGRRKEEGGRRKEERGRREGSKVGLIFFQMPKSPYILSRKNWIQFFTEFSDFIIILPGYSAPGMLI
jgi:hypothetical protein